MGQGHMKGHVWLASGAVAMAVAGLAITSDALAATPVQGTITADSSGNGNTITWTGSAHPGSETGGQDEGLGCFGSDNKPADTTTTGCDIFVINVNTPSADFYQHFIGGPQLQIANFGGSAP